MQSSRQDVAVLDCLPITPLKIRDIRRCLWANVMLVTQALPIEQRRVRFAVFLRSLQKLRHFRDAAPLA